MQKKRMIGIGLLAFAAVAAVWLFGVYHLVDFRLYPKNAAELDLRGQQISPAHYEKLVNRMPDIRILWDVPFGDETLDRKSVV